MARTREAAVINRYLEWLESTGGRRPNIDRLNERIAKLDSDMQTMTLTPIQRLKILQDRMNLEEEINSANEKLESDFIEVIKEWADANGISYAVLRQMNVPADVLRRAGMQP